MFTLNGKNIAQSSTDLKDHKCIGTAKNFKESIHIYNLNGDRIATITRRGLLVSSSIHPDTGTMWHSFATIHEIGKYKSFMHKVNEPRRIYEETFGFAPRLAA